MPKDEVGRAIAWGAFASVCLAPFLFGAVERSVWIPLCQLWLGAGLLSHLCARQVSAERTPSAGLLVSRALLPLHALFLVQLIPFPAAALRVLSGGSFAAHFLANPGLAAWRPLSVSPSATVEAWLYVAGLQGLFLALQGFREGHRRTLGYVLLILMAFLAGEGLWQSRTDHPFWLYGRIPIQAPMGLQDATFGPYLNRNHFATVMALGAAWAAGLAAARIRENGGPVRLLSHATALAEVVVLGGMSALLATAALASGSRSGALAAIGAIAFLLAPSLGIVRLIVPLGLGIAVLALSGTAAIDRLMRLDIVASRWAPWVDMTNLWRFFPAFGSGIGTFAEAYWPYQMNVAYEFWQHAHNEYLEWTIEGGLAGLVAAWLCARALRRSIAFTDWAREAARGVTFAIGLQAFLDFPLRVPANAALLVSVLALSVVPRSRRGGSA